MHFTFLSKESCCCHFLQAVHKCGFVLIPALCAIAREQQLDKLTYDWQDMNRLANQFNFTQGSLEQIMTSLSFGIISAIFFKLNREENSFKRILAEESGIYQLLNRYAYLLNYSYQGWAMCRYMFWSILWPDASEMSMKSALSLSIFQSVACSCNFFLSFITFLQYGVVYSTFPWAVTSHLFM